MDYKKIKKVIIIILIIIILVYTFSVIYGISSYIVYNIEKSYSSLKTRFSDFVGLKNNSKLDKPK